MPDASTVTPPTWLPGFASPIDLRVVVDMDLGQLPCDPDWVQQLKSSLHTALVQPHVRPANVDGDSGADAAVSKRCSVEMLPGERVNRDFTLRGRILDVQTSSSVVCETVLADRGDAASKQPVTHFAVTIVPRCNTAESPRQVVYLLDRSGSMDGWKMNAARRGLCRLIDRLSDRDHFQVAAFDDDLHVCPLCSPQQATWVAATDQNRFEAVRWLSNVRSQNLPGSRVRTKQSGHAASPRKPIGICCKLSGWAIECRPTFSTSQRDFFSC